MNLKVFSLSIRLYYLPIKKKKKKIIGLITGLLLEDFIGCSVVLSSGFQVF